MKNAMMTRWLTAVLGGGLQPKRLVQMVNQLNGRRSLAVETFFWQVGYPQELETSGHCWKPLECLRNTENPASGNLCISR